MQKIFRKSMRYVLIGSVLIIFVISMIVSVTLVKTQKTKEFNRKIDQIITITENNKREIASIKENLNADYLTRARAAAYVVENNADILENVLELKKLVKLLDVDEVHIIDENGVIIYSSVPKYVGIDFHDGRQTRAFLPILESDNKECCVIQEAVPNFAENKIMKYVGVARKDRKGIVQIGLEPVRLLEAQERNTYQYIFSRFPTGTGEEFFVIDSKSRELIGDSEGDEFLGWDVEEQVPLEELKNCEEGAFRQQKQGEEQFIVTREYKGELIGASISTKVLYSELWKTVVLILVCVLSVELYAVLFINLLIKNKIIKGIHGILGELEEITNGNLDTVVDIGGNPEFEELSGGINSMVKSIVHSTDRLTKIIDSSGIALAAFEWQNNMSGVFVTSGLRELLKLSEEETTELSKNPVLFYQKIQQIMKSPIEGETDIFKMDKYCYVRIHLSGEETGYLGVVTDVSRAIKEKKRMKYENVHDQLTGLRRYQDFKQKAEKILTEKPSQEVCAVIMMDLDGFKSINDTYGHGVGDEYLKEFAWFMKNLPEEHWLISRRSGDEFCMIGHGYAKRGELLQELEQFWNNLKQNEIGILKKFKGYIRVSGGIAWADHSETDVDKLLWEADEALYQAKKNHKGNFVEHIQN